MSWFCSVYFIGTLFILLDLLPNIPACWGPDVPKNGETSRDYDLLIGNDLVVNCSLFRDHLPQPVNSSNLFFKKDGESHSFSDYIHQIDALTAQLRIPNARVDNTGVYHCFLKLPDESSEFVCTTNVYVGYEPQNVSDFNCISKNFYSLTCRWNTKPNNVPTNYSLQKYLFGQMIQDCPVVSSNNTFCEWTQRTDPPYYTGNREITFVLHGNNSLGIIRNEFTLDHFAIVIPNSPEKLTVTEVEKQSLTVTWHAPRMNYITDKPDLLYQLWLEELEPNHREKIVIDAGIQIFNFTFSDLIPNFKYKVSVRCKSKYTEREDMWSLVATLEVKTQADIPYNVPEVTPEAYLMHNFENYRNVTLYWKPVSPRYYNGADFRYHIEYFKSDSSNDIGTSFTTTDSFAKIGHLQEDSPYIIHIYSANKEGISDNFETIFIDRRNKILPSPKDIRAISYEGKYYNLSWSMPGHSQEVGYRVFWCEQSLIPGYCGGPIQWFGDVLKENKFTLNLTNLKPNLQFAVAATYSNRSSGMQWASCIVSSKAPLGQIHITDLIQTSTTLKIIWKLDCESQKSVIDRYVMTYCKDGKDCKHATAGPDVETYTLTGLKPFSNYSVKLKAFNKQNQSSEDTEEKYQRTLSAGPSDPPENVEIYSVTDTSFYIKWTPPLEPNGIITHYFIYHNESKQRMENDYLCKVCEFHVKKLKEYTFYNVSVEACVGDSCMKSAAVPVVTSVGEPGPMLPPRVENLNKTHILVSWTVPLSPNGPIDFYDIQWHQQGENETSNEVVTVMQDLSLVLELKCGATYLFSVRAANLKGDMILYGPFSDPTKSTACLMPQGFAMIIGVAIGGTLVLAVFLLVLYKLVKWMSEKIHQVKNIAVKLPKELEGPETNPLNNYESFKNGLTKSAKIDISYAVDESENKNRHGSGSSQFSNTSTDELIFKNGKCTKFGRKPSGDSSGCSSMSSNTTTRMHLSSDSGTESDFTVPASPDSALNEPLSFHGQKLPMPILMEIHDPPLTMPGHQEKTELTPKTEKCTNLANGMVLKIDHPYSKFGISGNVTPTAPCQINPLAFYSCSLANSEPSVFEAQMSNKDTFSTMPPYSKMGLAKSSTDLISTSTRIKELGYSKFGLASPQECFSIDVEKLSPMVGMVMVENQRAMEISNSGVSNGKMTEDKSLFHCGNSPGGADLSNTYNPGSIKPSNGYVSVGDIMNDVRHLATAPTAYEEESLQVQASGKVTPDLPDVTSIWTSDTLCPSEENMDNLTLIQSDGDLHLTSSPSAGCVHIIPTANMYGTTCDFTTIPDAYTGYSENKQECLPDSEYTGTRSGSNKQTSDISQPSEVLLVPGRNGYVPFSTLSSVCDQPVSHVPNATDLSTSLSVFPSDTCTDIDKNYITPSNKSEFKLLQEGLVPKNKPFSSLLHCNNSKMHKISRPLKYILKPLPKMESEICEV